MSILYIGGAGSAVVETDPCTGACKSILKCEEATKELEAWRPDTRRSFKSQLRSQTCSRRSSVRSCATSLRTSMNSARSTLSNSACRHGHSLLQPLVLRPRARWQTCGLFPARSANGPLTGWMRRAKHSIMALAAVARPILRISCALFSSRPMSITPATYRRRSSSRCAVLGLDRGSRFVRSWHYCSC